MNLTSKNYTNFTAVYVNGVLQLYYRRDDLVGVQNYIEDRQSPIMFCIELTFKSQGTIFIEWDTREKWEIYIKFLDALLPC